MARNATHTSPASSITWLPMMSTLAGLPGLLDLFGEAILHAVPTPSNGEAWSQVVSLQTAHRVCTLLSGSRKFNHCCQTRWSQVAFPTSIPVEVPAVLRARQCPAARARSRVRLQLRARRVPRQARPRRVCRFMDSVVVLDTRVLLSVRLGLALMRIHTSISACRHRQVSKIVEGIMEIVFWWVYILDEVVVYIEAGGM